MTTIERRVWNILEDLGFKVLINETEYDPVNVFYFQMRQGSYRIDFAIPSLNIAIEVDGQYWHQGLRKINDQFRDQKLRKSGWKIIRISEQRIEKEYIESAILSLIDV